MKSRARCRRPFAIRRRDAAVTLSIAAVAAPLPETTCSAGLAAKIDGRVSIVAARVGSDRKMLAGIKRPPPPP
ncbi:unnamed protein product [Lactuca virosa]|uniref:Uncharacterized protein n=1 Tax=Lactuca virosa TaxID=75947 RepID=A0AAU9P5T9_9ASTR|nr:unnamed protein product [Lactuca virosa]